MKERYQQLLLQLLDAEPFKSTWYYQDALLAGIEQSVYEAMMFDELFTAEDVWRRGPKRMGVSLEKVQDQLIYMALSDGGQRLIFHDVLLEIYTAITQLMVLPASQARVQLAGCLRTIALETEDDGKVRRFLNEYVYLPKMLLLMLADYDEVNYKDEQRQKLMAIKPKFAKYYFNSCLDMLKDVPYEIGTPPIGQEFPSSLDQMLSIEAQAGAEDSAKRKVYGRIK